MNARRQRRKLKRLAAVAAAMELGAQTLGNDRDLTERLAKLRTDIEATRAIQCPRCELVSHHPGDVAQRYCGRCHWWTSDPLLGSEEVLAMAEASGVLKPVRP